MENTETPHEAMMRAILTVPGGISGTARGLGISRMAIHKWKAIPIERVHPMSRLTGIPPHELRPDLPDLFPQPAQGAANGKKRDHEKGTKITKKPKTQARKGR